MLMILIDSEADDGDDVRVKRLSKERTGKQPKDVASQAGCWLLLASWTVDAGGKVQDDFGKDQLIPCWVAEKSTAQVLGYKNK